MLDPFVLSDVVVVAAAQAAVVLLVLVVADDVLAAISFLAAVLSVDFGALLVLDVSSPLVFAAAVFCRIPREPNRCQKNNPFPLSWLELNLSRF